MVCLDEYMTFITLPCQHEICAVCYPKIVQMNSVCPICRHDFKEVRGEELYEVAIHDVRSVNVQVDAVFISPFNDRRCIVAVIVGACLLAFFIYATHR